MCKSESETRTPIDAYAIALDETAYYAIDEVDRPFIQGIRGVYLFDRNQRVYRCELTPSYRLLHLYDQVFLTDAGAQLDDDTIDELHQKYENQGAVDSYLHCDTIECLITRNTPFTVDHYGDTEISEQDVSYDEQMEALREYYCGNYPF